ncbi:MAG: cation:dicarboxylase symporter family transporter [Treponemataceae bacterium]|nr:MAG: cation:dicarboxylase symporter family transporter [Treponemataceae bacterium]
MKVWLKYAIGVVLGIVSIFVLPLNSPTVSGAIEYVAELVLRIGKYSLVPLLFFSLVVAIFSLAENRALIKTSFVTLALMLLSTFVLALLGVLSIVFIKLQRIPISVDRMNELLALETDKLVLALFPASAFSVFLNGTFLLPVFLLACFVGIACYMEKERTRTLMSLCDSCSAVFYTITCVIMDFLAIGMIAVACRWAVNFFDALSSGMYTVLLIVLTVDLLFVLFVLYPALFHTFVKKEEKHRPYKVLYAGTAPLIAAFFSGDANFVLPFVMRHAKENLGIQRRYNAFAFPLFSMFARGGSALVASVSFIVILNSYSSLGVSFLNALWIIALSSLISFLLAGLPSGGAFVVLVTLCALYGHGFEAGYLLLKPVSVVICAYSAAIDAATAIFCNYYAALNMNMVKHRDLRPFI